MNSRDHISRSKIRKAIEELPNANPSYSHTCDVVERDEVFEIIDNAQAVEGPKGEYVKGVVDALDKAFLLFDAKSTYSGERVLQIIEKLKWLEKLKAEKGSVG